MAHRPFLHPHPKNLSLRNLSLTLSLDKEREQKRTRERGQIGDVALSEKLSLTCTGRK